MRVVAVRNSALASGRGLVAMGVSSNNSSDSFNLGSTGSAGSLRETAGGGRASWLAMAVAATQQLCTYRYGL
ncbi:hypothetical protein B7463_g7066, partial [Scytalidium lignicola]